MWFKVTRGIKLPVPLIHQGHGETPSFTRFASAVSERPLTEKPRVRTHAPPLPQAMVFFWGTWGEIKKQMEIMLKRWKWAIIWYVGARGWESLSIFAGRIDYCTNVLYLFSASQNCSWKLKTRATSMPQMIGRHALGTCRCLYMLVGSINRPSLVSHVFGRDPLSVHAVPSIQAKPPETPHIPAVTEIGGAEAAKGKGRLVKLKRQAEGFLLGSGVNAFFGGVKFGWTWTLYDIIIDNLIVIIAKLNAIYSDLPVKDI